MTLFPETLTNVLPLKLLALIPVDVPLSNVNTEGNVTTILPVMGISFVVVNVIATLPGHPRHQARGLHVGTGKDT